MDNIYDEYYTTPHLFGAIYSELDSFFKTHPHRGNVIDLGCGQGRDAIALAQLGYKVKGVDISKVGVEQMLEYAKQSDISLEGIVADMHTFDIDHSADIIILDNIFHFLRNDRDMEIALIHRIASSLRIGGIICICIESTKQKVRRLKKAFTDSNTEWKVLNDSFFTYTFYYKERNTKIDAKINMYICQKVAPKEDLGDIK